MAQLLNLKHDGAGYQARAVLHMLDHIDGIEASWDRDTQEYTCSVSLHRFDNCREQGYILLDATTQLAVVLTEHRNTDAIVVASFRTQETEPTAESFFKSLPENATKWNMWDEEFRWGEIGKAAKHVIDLFEGAYTEGEDHADCLLDEHY